MATVPVTHGSTPVEPTSPPENVAGPSTPERSDREAIEEGLRREDAAFRTSDSTEGEREVLAAEIDKALFEELFGSERLDLWDRYAAGFEELRSLLRKHREDLRSKGALVRVELVDLRDQEHLAGTLVALPADRAFYVQSLHYENGGAGGLISFVHDGRMRTISGADEIAQLIEEKRESTR